MKETMKHVIRTLRLGNIAMVVEPDCGERAKIAMKQDNMLDMLDLFVDACKISEKKEDSKG